MLRLVVATVLLLFVAGCSEGNSARKPQDTATVGDEGLVVTRDGSSTYEFHDAAVECAKSDAGSGGTEVVRLTAPADYRKAFQKNKLVEPFLYVEVIPGVKGRRELPLQLREFDKGPSDVVVFGLDPEGLGLDAEEPNELSGGTEVSTGHIIIIEASCNPEPRLAFAIRATLGSEFSDGRSVHVQGGLEAGS